jgi:hypothetical protein
VAQGCGRASSSPRPLPPPPRAQPTPSTSTRAARPCLPSHPLPAVRGLPRRPARAQPAAPLPPRATPQAPGTEAAPTSTQRKRARQTKPLRSQAIIDAHKAVTPVVTARGAPRKLQRASAPAPAPAAPAAGRQPQKRKRAGGLSVKADMWEAEADMAGAAAAPEGAGDGAQPSTSGRHDPVSAPHEWRAQRLPAGKPSLAKRQRAQAASAARSIQPVEVDMGGCSFNPEYEQHQDALAEGAGKLAQGWAAAPGRQASAGGGCRCGGLRPHSTGRGWRVGITCLQLQCQLACPSTPGQLRAGPPS